MYYNYSFLDYLYGRFIYVELHYLIKTMIDKRWTLDVFVSLAVRVEYKKGFIHSEKRYYPGYRVG